MQCNRCGATLPPGATTCSNCGNPTPYNVSNQGASSPGYEPTVAAPPPYNAPPPQTGYGAPPYGAPQNPYESPQQPYGTPPPPSQPYGAPQQSYGAPQGIPYGNYPQNVPPKPRSRVGLIIGIILIVLLLACAGIGFAIYRVGAGAVSSVNAQETASVATVNAAATSTSNGVPTAAPTAAPTTQGVSPSGTPIAPSAAAIVTNPQMASAVNNTTPTQFTTTFKPKQTIYATFKLTGQAGYVQASWYYNGQPAFKSKILQAKADFTEGYFSAFYNLDGQGAVELYWCTQADCSDGQLAQVLTFNVAGTASTSTTHLALNPMDMDRRD